MKQIPSGQHQVTYGNTVIGYDLMYVERETLKIHVYPDQSVLVEAPLNSSLDEISRRVSDRARWIVKQQRTFETHQHPVPIRQYVSGESHDYLGKQYRLKVIEEPMERVLFYRGRIYLYAKDTRDRDRKQQLMENWYRSRARFIFEERLDACYPRVERFDIQYPGLRIRTMKSQWGSCSASGTITLNVRLIHVPKALIDYVVIHELCHLKYLNHGSEFYRLLDRVLPDWHAKRDRLNHFSYKAEK